MRRSRAAALFLTFCLTPVALADGNATVTFEAGTEGWSGPAGVGGATTVDPTGGNPGGNLHTVFNDFGITFRTTTHPGFVGDWTACPAVTISVDVRVDAIEFFGSPVSRPWLVELRDYDDPEPGYPYTSVWYAFPSISSATHSNWTTTSVTIEDTSATDLPPGWGGTGAETMLGEPILPTGRTFADVLAGVDEVVFTTLQPGFFFGFTDFDVRIDNVQRSAAAAVPLLDGRARLVLAGLVTAAGVVVLRRRRAARN